MTFALPHSSKSIQATYVCFVWWFVYANIDDYWLENIKYKTVFLKGVKYCTKMYFVI